MSEKSPGAAPYYCGWVWTGHIGGSVDGGDLHRFHACKRPLDHDGDHECRFCESVFELEEAA